MAFELSIYESDKRIIAHTLTCPTVGSAARTYQSGPMVKIGPQWTVVRCDRCRPNIFVVHVTSQSLRGKAVGTGYQIPPPPPDTRRGPNNATTHSMGEWNRIIHRNNPESSFPPYGVTALDITHSGNMERWQDDAECNSDDERLGPWLVDLFTGEHNEHWSLTIAKVVCSQCPVRAGCLEQGIWGNEQWGVWGGASERERKLLRAKWIREGRVDERPNRPRNPIYGQHNVPSEDGSRVAVTRGHDDTGVDEATGHDEATGQDMQAMSSPREVR